MHGDAPNRNTTTLTPRDIESRLKALAVNDLTGRTDLAQVAMSSGQPEAANQILRQVLAVDPGNVLAYSRLNEVAEQLKLEVESPVFRQARNLLPPRFVVTETKRFVVLSDADPAWTRTQIERIERAHHQFMRLANRLGLKPLPLEYKLVCVLFARQDDYAQFASDQDNVKDSWIAGYYSPRHDWIVFYDIRSNDGVKGANAKLERMQSDLALWNLRAKRAENMGQMKTADAMRNALAQYNNHFAIEKKKLDDFTTRAAIATTVHEAVHQLMFHTHIQLRTVEYPLWISEGMATSFETDKPNGAFGPDFDFKPRRDEFVRLLKEDKLIPLRTLVTLTDMPDTNPDTISALYHGSYALVTWMCRYRSAELRSYFETMQREPNGRSTPGRHLEIFTSIFGDIDRLERAWIRYEMGKAELSMVTVPWARRLAREEQLIALNDPPGMETIRLAGVQVYGWLFSEPFAVAANAGLSEPADSTDLAAAGSVTISAARTSDSSPE